MPLQGHGDWSGRDLGEGSEIHVEDMHMLVSQQLPQPSALLRSGDDTTTRSLVCCCSLGPAQTPSLSLLVLIVATPLHTSRWPSLFWPLTPAQERPAGAECMQREDVGGSTICKNNCRASLRRQCVNWLARCSTTSLDHRYQRFSHLKRPCTAAPF
jgi:hypothetical protein